MAALIILLLLMCIINCAYFDFNGFIIKHPCKKTACFQRWSGHFEMVIVTNGQMEPVAYKAEDSECTLPIKALNNQDRFCARNPCEPGLDCLPFTPVINTYPRQSASFQCAPLSSLIRFSCHSRLLGWLVVKWVDDDGNPIQEGAEYRITRSTQCDVSLTVSLQSPKNVTFRCVTKVNGQTWKSEKIQVRLPPPRGKGRRIVPQPGDGDSGVQAGSTSVVAPTVGVLCAVVVVAAALFALNKRRTNARTSAESHTSTADYELDPEEVIYADVVLPASSDRVCESEDGHTVYAGVRCS